MLSLGNDNENDKKDEILHKKKNQIMTVQLMSHYCLHHKNLKKSKDGNWGMTTRTMKSMKLCIYHYLYLYAFIGVNYVISLVCFIIYCNSFYHYNEDHNLKIEVIQIHIEVNKVL